MNKDHEQIIKKIGINKKTFNLLFRDYIDFFDDNDEKDLNSAILNILELYTQINSKNLFQKIKFKLKTGFSYSDIKFNKKTNFYEFNLNEKVYNFDKLSRTCDNKEEKKELESDKRYGYCHSVSEELAMNLPEATILTGYIRRFNDKYLHSVVEYDEDGKKLIIDYTKNLIMPKKQYTELTDFELLESNYDLDYIENMKIIGNISELDYVPAIHLPFGKEIAKDLKKNQFLFKENPELTKYADKLIQLKLEEREKLKNNKTKAEDEEER